MYDFDLRSLEIFAAVVDTRSMTLAAKQLGITQPAVSHAVSKLEEVFGVPLIDRRRRPLGPTTAGDLLAHLAAQMLQDAQHMPDAMRQLEDGRAMRLRMGLVDSLSSPFVPQLVARLRAAIGYLSVSSGLARNLRNGLLEHRLDLVITNDPFDDVDGVRRHEVLWEPYFVVLPPTIAAADHELDLMLLARTLPLVRWNAHSLIGAEIERQLRRMRVVIPRQFEFDSAVTIVGMVAAGLGWAVMTPLSVFDISPSLARVRIAPFPGPSFSRRLLLVSRQGEIDGLAERMVAITRGIFEETYIPAIVRMAPWLAGKVQTE